MSTQSVSADFFVTCRLREVRGGQVLHLTGSRFAVLTKERRRRLVHLLREAEDGAHATLIGVPGARVGVFKAPPQIGLEVPGGGARAQDTDAAERQGS